MVTTLEVIPPGSKPINVAETLRAIRKKLELDQPKLANRLKVSFQSVNAWEANKWLPRENALLAINSLAKEAAVPPVIFSNGHNGHTNGNGAKKRPKMKKKAPQMARMAKGRRSKLTPQQAVQFLMGFAATSLAERNFIEPVTVLVEHVTRLEQTITELEAGILSAMRQKPEYAIVGRRRGVS